MSSDTAETPFNLYLRDHGGCETPVLAELRRRTAALGPAAQMQISPEQGGFLAWLVEMIGAQTVLEIGCFTGYSALCMAGSLPAGGRIVTCDINREWTDLAQDAWRRSEQASKIQLHLGPAKETLDSLVRQGLRGRFDFAFIDADKPGYDCYYEQCLELVRPGGIIAIDNTLWSGRVVDLEAQDEATLAIRALNAKARADRRVSSCLLPIGDGLTLLRVVARSQ